VEPPEIYCTAGREGQRVGSFDEAMIANAVFEIQEVTAVCGEMSGKSRWRWGSVSGIARHGERCDEAWFTRLLGSNSIYVV
jgi:hypothetical protein